MHRRLPMSQTAAPKNPAVTPPNVKAIGRYAVLRVLRRDRYTTAYLAFDPVLHRELVIKAAQLHPNQNQLHDRAAHERVEQAFMRQAQAAGRLHHPHIVTVFDAGHVNQIGYLALEKVDGKLLEDLLVEGFRPGFLQAADIVARVADAIEFAHSRAIPHGHLAPSRIYLQGTERNPKVTGFGGWIDSGITGDFELHATERMLPFFGNEISSEARRKDIRALGALLFLLLTGARPDAKLLRGAGQSLESPVLQLKPNAPVALAEIAEQALELGGSRVYATAAQVRNALTMFLWGNRGELPLPNSATITGMPARLAVMPKRQPPLTVATLAALPVHAEAERSRSSWRMHVVSVGVGFVAVIVMAGIMLRTEADQVRTRAAAQGAAAPVGGVRFAPLSRAEAKAAAPIAPVQAPAGSAASGAPSVDGVDRPAAAPRTAPRDAPSRTAAAPAPRGVVAFAVIPWGEIYIDGEAHGTSPPLMQLMLPAGRHTIEIRNGERPPYVAQVDVSPDRPQQLRHRFP
jgi:hypothetical protein